MIRRVAAIVALVAAVLAPACCLADGGVPVVPVGGAIALDAPPSSLLRLSVARATFRVPRTPTVLYVATLLQVRDLRVTVVGPGSRRVTLVAVPELPGHVLGLQLPSDAWTADRIELQATTASNAASPYLLSAEALARIGWRDWQYDAAFGLFLALALLCAVLAIATRAPAAAWYAVLAAAQGAQLIPWLGIVRPPPEISQPAHAVLRALVLAGTVAFAQAYFRDARWPRLLMIPVWSLVLLNVIDAFGGDVLQDIWLVPFLVKQGLFSALMLAYVALGISAARAGARGAAWFIAATATGAAGILLGDGDTTSEIVIQTAALEAVLFTIGLMLRARGVRAVAVVPRDRWETRDGLTGVSNRPALDASLASAWEHARTEEASLAAVLVDVDHFRAYNETYGHLAGDDVLRRIGASLSTVAVRREDARGRYAGDKYLVLLANTDLAGARHVAETIYAAVVALEIAHGGVPSKRLSVSIGAAAMVPAYEGDGTALVRRAETALYLAKTMGRNRVVVDEPVEPQLSVLPADPGGR